MDYFYSPSTRGFYLEEIHGDGIPEDALPVSEELHAQLLDPPEGFQIGLNADGLPALVERPPLPVLVPQVVSRFQGREAMWRTPHGDTSLFEAAEAVINHPDTPATYRRAWADLQEFRRDSEMLVAVASALGLSSADLDGLFILAGGIKA